MRRFLAIILLLALSCSLTACGGGTQKVQLSERQETQSGADTEAQAESTPAPGTVADDSSAVTGAGLAIAAPEGELVSGFLAQDGKYYLLTMEDSGQNTDFLSYAEGIVQSLPTTPGIMGVPTVYEVDVLQGTLTPLALPFPKGPASELAQALSPEEQPELVNFTLEADGSAWLFTTVIAFPDGEAGEPEQSFTLSHYGPDGTVLGQVDWEELTGVGDRGMGQPAPWSEGSLLTLAEGDGGAYVIRVLDYAGNVTTQFDVPGRAMDLAVLDDGSVLLWSYMGDEDGYQLLSVDVQAGTTAPLPLEMGEGREDGFFSILCGDADTVWLDDRSSLYRYDRASGALERQLSWVDRGMTGLAAAFLKDGALWVAEYGDGLRSVRLSPLSLEGDGRQALTLGCFFCDDATAAAVAAFNRENADYRIELRDYGNNESEPLTRFLNDIVAGDVPDMFSLYDLPYDRLRELGLLADLSGFIDADPDIRREDYLPAMWDAVTVDGQVLSVVTGFLVGTYWGEGDVTREDFTLAKYEAMCQESRPLFQFDDRPEVRASSMRGDLLANVDQFVDLEAGTCSFDSPAFRDLLRAEKAMTVAGYGEQDDHGRLAMAGISSYADVGMLEWTTPLGFPTPEGGKFSFAPRAEYAITTKCAAPEACWQFLRQFLLKDYDPNGGFWLPVKYSALETMAAVQMGEPNSEVTGRNVETVNAVLASPMFVYRFASFQDEIFSIVSEELTAYFADAASMDAVIANLQSRVGLYLSERQ